VEGGSTAGGGRRSYRHASQRRLAGLGGTLAHARDGGVAGATGTGGAARVVAADDLAHPGGSATPAAHAESGKAGAGGAGQVVIAADGLHLPLHVPGPGLSAGDAGLGRAAAMKPLELREARQVWARARGLIGYPRLRLGQGLLIHRCREVHGWGMRYPLDVAFL